MRLCKLCNSNLVLKLSFKEPYKGKYFWGCSNYPNCNNTETTILKRDIPASNYYTNYLANSLRILKPDDIASDAERHSAICKTFEVDQKFGIEDLYKLDFLLGFEEQYDFFFWVATQKKIITLRSHHYLPVGSPYYTTFQNLRNSLNEHYQNIIESIIQNQRDKIAASIISWTDFFNREKELRRRKVSEETILAQYQDAVKRISEKASVDIFNAIRRRDVKAIIALRRKGVNLNTVNSDGLNCLEYAKTLNDGRVIEALTKIIL